TADHGVCPLPEHALQGGTQAGRISTLGLLSKLDAYLQSTGAKEGDAKRWIESASEGGIYLNYRAIAAAERKPEEIATVLAHYLSEQPGIQTAYTRAQLMNELPPGDVIGRRVQKSFHPDRSGDVLIVVKPYHFIGSQKTGTTHGTPHP